METFSTRRLRSGSVTRCRPGSSSRENAPSTKTRPRSYVSTLISLTPMLHLAFSYEKRPPEGEDTAPPHLRRGAPPKTAPTPPSHTIFFLPSAVRRFVAARSAAPQSAVACCRRRLHGGRRVTEPALRKTLLPC